MTKTIFSNLKLPYSMCACDVINWANYKPTLEEQTWTEFSTSLSLISLFQVPEVLGSELPTWIVSAFPFNFYMEISQIIANIANAPNLFLASR